MLNETLDKLIQNEINKGIKDYKGNYNFIKKELNKYKSYCNELTLELNKVRKLNKQIEEFNIFKESINKDNIESMVSILGLDENEIDFYGMNSEQIPTWFKLLCIHYNDKDRLFTLMDMLNIEYPYWAKQFKMPFDYDEEVLDLIFQHLHKMYVCNGEIFSNNMGFFWQYQNKHKGDIKSLFRESYVEIPWNLFLQNPLLTTEKYFNKIIKAIQSKNDRSDYFYMIQKYQELSDDQIGKMAELLPTGKFYSYHSFFLENNGRILKQRIDLAKKYKDKMSDYKGSVFYFLNYPVEMQKEFVLNHSDKYSSYGFEMVSEMDIPVKEKLHLLNEVAKKHLIESEDDE